jgi:hypothetical protein
MTAIFDGNWRALILILAKLDVLWFCGFKEIIFVSANNNQYFFPHNKQRFSFQYW